MDKHEKCPRWSDDGYCDIYSNYMYKKCPLSCEACYLGNFVIQSKLEASICSRGEAPENFRGRVSIGRLLIGRESGAIFCTDQLAWKYKSLIGRQP